MGDGGEDCTGNVGQSVTHAGEGLGFAEDLRRIGGAYAIHAQHDSGIAVKVTSDHEATKKAAALGNVIGLHEAVRKFCECGEV